MINWLRSLVLAVGIITLAACGGGGSGTSTGGGGADPDQSTPNPTHPGNGDTPVPALTDLSRIGFDSNESDLIAYFPAINAEDVAMLLMRELGSQAMALTNLDSSGGDARRLIVLFPSGDTLEAILGEEDRVAELSTQGHRFVFSNYTADTVDVDYFNPNGALESSETIILGEIPDNGEPPSILLNLTGTWRFSFTGTETCIFEGETYVDDFRNYERSVSITQQGIQLSIEFVDDFGQTRILSGTVEDGALTVDETLSESGVSAEFQFSANADHREISGGTYSIRYTAPDETCDESGSFSANLTSSVASIQKSTVAPKSLDDLITESLRFFSDPFEVDPRLNLFRKAGEAVEDLVERAKARFDHAVDQAAGTAFDIKNGARCLIDAESCARNFDGDASNFVKEISNLDPEQKTTAGLSIDAQGTRPNLDEWNPLVSNGTIDTSFSVIDIPCEEQVFSAMNPDCPDYVAPETQDPGPGDEEPDLGSAPVLTGRLSEDGRVTLEWSAVEGADYYLGFVNADGYPNLSNDPANFEAEGDGIFSSSGTRFERASDGLLPEGEQYWIVVAVFVDEQDNPTLGAPSNLLFLTPSSDLGDDCRWEGANAYVCREAGSTRIQSVSYIGQLGLGIEQGNVSLSSSGEAAIDSHIFNPPCDLASVVDCREFGSYRRQMWTDGGDLVLSFQVVDGIRRGELRQWFDGPQRGLVSYSVEYVAERALMGLQSSDIRTATRVRCEARSTVDDGFRNVATTIAKWEDGELLSSTCFVEDNCNAALDCPVTGFDGFNTTRPTIPAH